MLAAATRYVRAWARRQEPRIPGGYSWTFALTADIVMVLIGVIATLQRPMSDWPAGTHSSTTATTPRR